MAREASGSDSGTTRTPNTSASPNPSPTPPPQQYVKGPNLAFTGNSSPANDRIEDNNTKQDGNQQQANGNQVAKPNELSAPLLQSHANVTQSIYVEEFVVRGTPERVTTSSLRTPDRTNPSSVALKPTAAVLPPFGTMLPVRTQGVVFTLRNNSYARLELMRDCAGAGWSLAKGTILVGRTSGSESDRAFVNVIGFIDPRDNKLVKMSGEVMGADGASGIPGKRVGVDRNRLKETLRKVASSGIQVAGTMAGALTGRGTVVIDSAGYRLLNPVTSDARGMVGGSNDRNSFVKVEAGRSAYVMVADLPKALQSVDAPGDEDIAQAAHALTDREVMELILFGTPDEIRAAFPLMSDEQKKLAVKSVGEKQ
jgi:predicted enzyme related to lactoylglutathione lyase